MHEHDLDLVAEHAEGLLSGEAAEAARALVETCAACRLEFESQRRMRSLMGSLSAPSLTDSERHRLRQGVLAQLEPQVVTTPAPVVDLALRRQRRWVALGSVAAGVFVFVGLAGLLPGIIGGTDETTLDAAVEQADGEVGATEATVPAESMMAPSVAESASDAAEEAPAAAETEAGSRFGAEGDDTSFVSDLGPVSVETLQSVVDEALARAAELAPSRLEAAYFNDRERPVPVCWSRATGPVTGVLTAEVDSTSIEVFLIEGPPGEGYRAEGFDAVDCLEYPLD